MVERHQQANGLALLLAIVMLGVLAPVARSILHVAREIDLVDEIVIDNPFAPGELKPVPIKGEPGEESISFSISRRSGIESDPAVSGEIRFDPSVSVACADNVVAAQIVVFTRQESADVTRGDSEVAQHDGHGGGEIFAVSGAAREEKIGQRIVRLGAAKIERVSVMRFQIALDICGAII